MSQKELKKVLQDSLALESELLEFIEECLKRIYGDKSKQAIAHFNETVEYVDNYGCLQGLGYIDRAVNSEEEA